MNPNITNAEASAAPIATPVEFDSLVEEVSMHSTVPTPLKFHGRIVGTPGELTYAKDIHRYLEAIAKCTNLGDQVI